MIENPVEKPSPLYANGSPSHNPRWLKRLPKRFDWRWIAAGVVLLFVVLFLITHHRASSSGKKSKAGGAMPVAVAASKLGDVPVYFDGLGSVNAYYTVTLHSRVDGQLMSVNFREGQTVDAGELLAEIDPRPFQAQLDQAEGALAKDQALLKDAQVDLERYQGLLALNAIPKQQLDTQVATVGQAEGSVKSDQAAVETAQLNLTYSKITAPIAGRIGLRLVDPGNIVHAADANGILVITQLHPISVIFTLPEDSLPAVMQKIAAHKTLPVEAFNRDKTQHLASGKLLTVDNQIDPTTGTSKLKAVFDNHENALFPNQFVNVRLLLDTLHNQVIVPAVSLQRGAQGMFVYVVKPDSTVEVRPVKVGITEGTDASIESGLMNGENVVVDGADKLQSGSIVSVASSSGTVTTDGSSKGPHSGGHKHHPPPS